MWYGHYGSMMGWGGGFGFVAMGIFVVFVLFLIAAGASLLFGGSPRGRDRRSDDSRADARAALDARYVSGQISRDEYLRMKRDLVD